MHADPVFGLAELGQALLDAPKALTEAVGHVEAFDELFALILDIVTNFQQLINFTLVFPSSLKKKPIALRNLHSLHPLLLPFSLHWQVLKLRWYKVIKILVEMLTNFQRLDKYS